MLGLTGRVPAHLGSGSQLAAHGSGTSAGGPVGAHALLAGVGLRGRSCCARYGTTLLTSFIRSLEKILQF